MKRQEDAGFSLVEVLVGFVILAGAIILGFQVFADGLRRLSTVEARMKDAAVARAELARLSAADMIAEGVQTGTTDGVPWQITVTGIGGASTLRPLKVEIRVLDRLVMETIMLSR